MPHFDVAHYGLLPAGVVFSQIISTIQGVTGERKCIIHNAIVYLTYYIYTYSHRSLDIHVQEEIT